MDTTRSIRSCLRSGVGAGMVSALAFAIIHHLFISNIWFSLIPMLVAGALCGLCVAWTYGLLFETPSVGSWVRYNMVYVASFGLLGGVSVLVFEPITTVGALIATNEPPDALIRQAMPLTIIFTLAMAALISRLYGRSRLHYGAILLTCILLILCLGLNVSVIGLVYIPGNSLYLIAELFGLILAINLVYVAGFIALERKRLVSKLSRHSVANPVIK